MFDLTYACLLCVDGFGVDGRGHFGSLSWASSGDQSP
jgi:hypothetical protein